MTMTIVNAHRDTPPTWTLSVVSFLVMTALLQIGGMLLFKDKDVLPLLFQIFLVVWTVCIICRNAIELPALLGSSHNKTLELLWTASLIVPMLVIGGVLGLMLFYLASAQPELLLKSFASKKSASGLDTLTAILSICVVPVIEELVFRGLLFNFLSTRTTTGRALIYSSLLFASMHAQSFGVIQFFLSILFTLAYFHTRWLVMPVILHALWNCIPYGASWFGNRVTHDGPQMADVQQLASTLHVWLPVLAGSLIVGAAAAIFLLIRFWPGPQALTPYQLYFAQR